MPIDAIFHHRVYMLNESVSKAIAQGDSTGDVTQIRKLEDQK